MSADNLVAVAECKDGFWYVWEAFSSLEIKGVPANAEGFTNRAAALDFAHNLAAQLQPEYGVQIVTDLPI